MRIELTPLIEPFDIAIGDTTIHCDIAMTTDYMKASADKSREVSPKMKMVEQLFDKAKAQGDETEAIRTRMKMFNLFEEYFDVLVGHDKFEEIVDAATNGDSSLKPYITAMLTEILEGLNSLVRKHNESIKANNSGFTVIHNDTAAMRDSQEIDIAQPVTVPEV